MYDPFPPFCLYLEYHWLLIGSSLRKQLLNSSSSEISCVHFTFTIHRKQRIIKIWSLLKIYCVTFHVSKTYRKTDIALVLKSRSLVVLETFSFFITRIISSWGNGFPNSSTILCPVQSSYTERAHSSPQGSCN